MKYPNHFETIKRLREKIRKKEIESILIPKGHQDKDYTCYFCENKIEKNSDMRILIERGEIRGHEVTSSSPVDEVCYQFSKKFVYVSNPRSFLN